jgi:hypothetical protein
MKAASLAVEKADVFKVLDSRIQRQMTLSTGC